jgi:hypothetical protein
MSLTLLKNDSRLAGSAPPSEASDENASPEQIALLADQLVNTMQQASRGISKINDRARLLALNAQIEAARAGHAGAAFGIVASAMRDLSDKTSCIAEDMATDLQEANDRLQGIIRTLAGNVRGTRLSDLALTNIDLIDRNLYERSCDVRWWATDSSSVQALTENTPAACQHSAHRFGVILNSYTVYYDLVLCDLEGRVVANGRPEQYRSVGRDCAGTEWFQSALRTHSGEEFGFQTVHANPLVGDQRALVYSCCVRAGGDVHGVPIGVLGIIFNWDALAQTILENTPLVADEKSRCRICIVDKTGFVLADTGGRQLKETLHLPDWPRIQGTRKGFVMSSVSGRECCIGHALSPGYETYATGWISLLIQE